MRLRASLLCSYIWILLMLLPMLRGHAEAGERKSAWLMSRPSSDLLHQAEEYLNMRGMPDSALVCYTIVASRYEPGMTREQLQECLEGYYGRWRIQSFGYGNLGASVSDLIMAENIAREGEISTARLDYFNGVCFMSIASVTSNKRYYSRATQYFLKSLEESAAIGDTHTAHIAFDNLVTSRLLSDSIDYMERELKIMEGLKDTSEWRKRFSRLIYQGAKAQYHQKYPEALASFSEMLTLVPRTPEYHRYLAAAFNKQSRVQQLMGDNRGALRSLDSCMELTYRFNSRDMRQSALARLTSVYQDMGEEQKAEETNRHYLRLKDSVMHTNFIVNFKQADFDRHNAEMQNHIAELDYRSRLKGWILFFAAILIISILIFLGAQLNTNRKLKARTRLLHDQLSAAAKQDERWVDTVPAMTSDKVNDRDTEMEEGSGPDGGNAKYQGSLLADEEKERIAAKIRDVVTNSNEIYSSDFTLARLAGMVGSTSKYVSQVVNEKFGCNFWTLVNRARIREAMRRLDDLRNYSDWSIEGIAESVGFRSRSTFTSWFRKFAGMSAAEYRQHSNE